MTEEAEKRAENLRLLYVACTRAMESLIIPDFTWSNDESWAKLLSFRPDTIPELDVSRFPRTSISPPSVAENLQSAEIFAEEQSRLEATPKVRWITPSDADPDVISEHLASEASDEEPLRPMTTLQGGRIRGILLHKLMEELVTGELEERLETATSRAEQLRDQLFSVASSTAPVDATELASTALNTLRLPDIKRFRSRLMAEVPIHAIAPAGPDHLIAGRADAIAEVADGSTVVFDWKSDIASTEADRAAYRQQLAQYLHATGAQRGAIVYMTFARIDWVIRSPEA
jgi:CRISPR-associated exonuclease Cas4